LCGGQGGNELVRPARRGEPVGRAVCWVRDLDFDDRINPAAEAHVGEAIEAGTTFRSGFRFLERLDGADELSVDARTANPTVVDVTVIVGVESTNMVVMMARRTRAAIMPVAALIGPNIRMPAPDRPTTTIQIHTEGHSFSVYKTSEAEGVFRAGVGEDWSGVGMGPAYRALACPCVHGAAPSVAAPGLALAVPRRMDHCEQRDRSFQFRCQPRKRERQWHHRSVRRTHFGGGAENARRRAGSPVICAPGRRRC
jgi:hypothetical protein